MTKVDEDHAGLRRSRRRFITAAGAGLAAAGLLNISDAFAARGARVTGAGAVNLGSGDVGVLNYAYALEQFEAAFYTLALAHPYAGMTAYDRALLSDIRSHEVAHVRFLREALGSARIADLDVDFSSVDFSKRGSVLTTAQTFEDLGVAAYNGAGKLLKDPAHLLAAGTIVSVEARHAAMLHDLMAPLTDGFGGHPNGLGLDGESSPSSVLASTAPFVRTRIDASQIG